MTDISNRPPSGTEIRRQGRPRHSEREVGRDKLLEWTRAAMNLRPRTDIQRREIADAIGVTPALISYYFPDKWSLLEAAARPIIAAHIAEIEALLSSKAPTEEKLKVLISTYISFNREHGYLLDYFISSTINLNKTENLQMLAESHARIVAFFEEGVKSGVFKNTNVELIHSMIWSVCQYIGRMPESQHIPIASPENRLEFEQAKNDAVFDFLLNGLMPSTCPPALQVP